jgi:Flp pilus assembly protein TadD
MHQNVADALLARGDTAGAVRELSEVVRLQPESPEAALRLAAVLGRSGDLRGAVAQLRRAAELAPENAGILDVAARGLATCPDKSLRDGPMALELALRANRLNGGHDPSTLRTLAAAYRQTGSREQADATLRRALQAARDKGDAALAAALLSDMESNGPEKESPVQPPVN